jgi:hypothetical protein
MAYDQYDIYMSYAPEDQDRARKIMEELEWTGLRVWFYEQPTSPAESQAALRSFLGPNTCHIVIWSDNSAGSGRMQAEARTGSAMRRLIAVRIDNKIIPPRGTEATTYADMTDWQGGQEHRGMKKLLGGIWNLIQKGVQPAVEELPGPVQIPVNPIGNTGGVREDELTPEQKDERAWQACLAYNTKTYYENYLRYFPTGRHVSEAKERIAKKRRTTNTIIACAIIYVVVQVIFSIVVNIM